MIYQIRNLLIVSLIITSNSALAETKPQLHNKQFIFGPVRVSSAVARATAVSTLYGGWKAFDRLDIQRLSDARESVSGYIGNGVVRVGTSLVKGALLALIAERVYDYVHTVANYATWPAYAARIVQLQVNELIVVQSLYDDVVMRLAERESENRDALIQPWQQLLKQYHENAEKNLSALTDIGFYVGDEISVQLLEALRHDLDNHTNSMLDRYEIMDFVRHDEMLHKRLQALYAACDHLQYVKENVRAADLHACHHELRVLHEMFTTLQENRAMLLADALRHCNRIASVNMSKDVISGAVQYAQWRITNAFSSDN